MQERTRVQQFLDHPIVLSIAIAFFSAVVDALMSRRRGLPGCRPQWNGGRPPFYPDDDRDEWR